MKLHLVLAGNFSQAIEYAKMKGWSEKEWVYIGSRQRVLGYDRENTICHVTGTWWERRDAREIISDFKALYGYGGL